MAQVLNDKPGVLVTRGFTQVLTQAYEAVVAPHAITTRWTYTVPSGRIAFLEAVHSLLEPTTAANQAGTFILVTRSGGGAQRFYTRLSGATIYDIGNDPYDVSLAAGDVVTGQSSNGDAVAREIRLAAYFREITL